MKLKRWTAVIVGELSGRRAPLTFVRFWRKRRAQSWVDGMNARKASDSGTHYEVTRL